MNNRSNIKTATIVVALLALLAFVIGAAQISPTPQVGRFQIDCTSNSCYLVDTATGQIWHYADRDYYSPKLKLEPEKLPTEAKNFTGQWKSEDQSGKDLTLWLETDGNARGGEDDKIHDGKWRIQGDQITITIDEETIHGRLEPDGRLILWDGGAGEGERIHFKKVK